MLFFKFNNNLIGVYFNVLCYITFCMHNGFAFFINPDYHFYFIELSPEVSNFVNDQLNNYFSLQMSSNDIFILLFWLIVTIIFLISPYFLCMLMWFCIFIVILFCEYNLYSGLDLLLIFEPYIKVYKFYNEADKILLIQEVWINNNVSVDYVMQTFPELYEIYLNNSLQKISHLHYNKTALVDALAFDPLKPAFLDPSSLTLRQLLNYHLVNPATDFIITYKDHIAISMFVCGFVISNVLLPICNCFSPVIIMGIV